MLQSSDSWRSGLQNGHTDNGVGRGANRLGIRSPTDDLMLDEPIVRLGRRGVAARMRADTDPLGLRSAITDHGTATRTRRRASPASEDHGPTLEELLEKKTEARRQERLSEQRQLEIADTLYPFGRRPGALVVADQLLPHFEDSCQFLDLQRYSPWGKGVGNPSPNQNFRRRSRERTIAEEAHSTGWSTSDHNPKKTKDEMREYLESLKGQVPAEARAIRERLPSTITLPFFPPEKRIWSCQLTTISGIAARDGIHNGDLMDPWEHHSAVTCINCGHG
ncbi:hypothetical protein HPB52_023812 [Rhipicephalus sanguineus]|uniref:Uncharacterized protein n=1 Tax=Rhipicephalus sanguineus TaxID=34632 RepID=A0A9D4PTY9_RHISA|nr:hypothetical protein HPB52_023812 [Rhipicephalus sanguineus]